MNAAPTLAAPPPRRTKEYRIICTHMKDGWVTRAEVREASEAYRDNPKTPDFESTAAHPITDCKRFIEKQPQAKLYSITYL